MALGRGFLRCEPEERDRYRPGPTMPSEESPELRRNEKDSRVLGGTISEPMQCRFRVSSLTPPTDFGISFTAAMASIFDAAAAGDIGAMNGFLDADDVDIDAKEAQGSHAMFTGTRTSTSGPLISRPRRMAAATECVSASAPDVSIAMEIGMQYFKKKEAEYLPPEEEHLDALGNTALHCAAKAGEAAAGSLLVECSADVNLVDAHGNTPLILAGIHDKRLVASMLLWGGAERDQQNHRGNTALHEAAISGAKDVAWLIVENGGERSVRIKNQDGRTPLDIAKESGHPNADLLELLEGAEREMAVYLSKKAGAAGADQASKPAGNDMMSPD
ncbi:Inversin [Symbiodinium microadriaticum]|uniref:Inversin n=1 Tax=Symbiodinium microadriaticum TaxID=2951 RepID=A0A1Q9EMM0_SYMMI|nr:Inversin [Symbiodinium microadriaticum]